MLSTNSVTLTHLELFSFEIVSVWKLSYQGDTFGQKKRVFLLAQNQNLLAPGNNTWVFPVNC